MFRVLTTDIMVLRKIDTRTVSEVRKYTIGSSISKTDTSVSVLTSVLSGRHPDLGGLGGIMSSLEFSLSGMLRTKMRNTA